MLAHWKGEKLVAAGGRVLWALFHPGEVVNPRGLILGNEAPEAGLKLLIEAFCLTTGLRVVVGGHAECGTEKQAKLAPKT